MEWLEVEPKERKMNDFKVGDYVSSKSFEGVKKITRINNDNDTINVKGLIFAHLYKNCEIVCNFVKGQEIEVAKGHGFIVPKKRIFNQYRPELEKPFECVMQEDERKFENNELYNINAWKYARAIQPEYKAYSVPKLSWLNERVRNNKTGDLFRIESIVKHYSTYYINLIKKTDTHKIDMEDLVKEWAWEDGKPCGVLNETN